MWYELQIACVQPDKVDVLSEWLVDFGALSVSLSDENDDAILEPAPGSTPLWPEVLMSALFNNEADAQCCKEQMHQAYPDLSTSIRAFADQEWQRVCMDQFKPQLFGKNLWICPSWSEPEAPLATNIMLDPGLAFGTGTHPTTALCLEWLDGNPPTQKSLIDYGCGSGILAIAARKLGARQIIAVDIDDQALEATADNALKNQCLDEQMRIMKPDQIAQSVDWILANILLGPLQQLKDHFHQHLNPEGLLIVSGLLSEQAESLIDAYEPCFSCIEKRTKEEWALLVFKRIPQDR